MLQVGNQKKYTLKFNYALSKIRH